MAYNQSVAGLADIRDVTVDHDLPKAKRIADYKRQIADYTHYKYKNVEVKACFTKGGPSIEDCLMRLMA